LQEKVLDLEETAKSLCGGIWARVEGGYGDRAAGVGAEPETARNHDFEDERKRFGGLPTLK
jgi:hypothetical protein